jgi:hypothetical protein
MKSIEDYRYCLDCFMRPYGEVEAGNAWERPDDQEGGDDREALEKRAQALIRAGRFKCVVLYGVAPDGDWQELDFWPRA